MLKGRYAVLSLAVAALFCWQMLPANVDTVVSGLVDPCSSSASSASGNYFTCPGQTAHGGLLTLALTPPNLTITVTAKDYTGTPIAGIPAADVWLIGCNDALSLCGMGIAASAATDASGVTTITGRLVVGGCDLGGVQVVVQGVVIANPLNWNLPLCLAIKVRTPDFVPAPAGSKTVTAGDFSFFSAGYPCPGPTTGQCTGGTTPVNLCRDLVPNGAVSGADFARFTGHYPPSGTLHNCTL